ncbi:MAG: lipase family protein [Spirochaetales bacterium]
MKNRIVLLVLATIVGFSAWGQRTVPGWQTPEPGALLSVIYEERVSPQEIFARGVPLFEQYEHPAPIYGADAYRIVFWTSDYDGSPVRASALLVIPVTNDPIEAPVLAFGSGTSGLGDHCAPSLENARIQRLGWYRENMLAYAGQGIITIFPDYIGFNDTTIPQRYFVKAAEGHLMLDALRAARAVATSTPIMVRSRTVPSSKSFTAGYSQGGHAALAAADMMSDYAPEIELAGAIGFGATNSVEALFRDAGFYPPSILYTYMQIYGAARIRVERILRPEWLEDLESRVMQECVFNFQFTYPANVQELFTEPFYNALVERRLDEEFPEIKQILDENEAGLDGHGVPVLMVQGNQDWIAPNRSVREFVGRLRAAGSEVKLIEIEDVRHRQTRPAGFVDSVEFIRSLID